MKTLLRVLVLSAFLYGSLSTAPAQDDNPPEPKPDAAAGIDPKALELFYEMLAKYRGLMSFTCEVTHSYDNNGQGYSARSTVSYQKPRRIEVRYKWEDYEYRTVTDGNTLFYRHQKEGEVRYFKADLPSEEYGELALLQYPHLDFTFAKVLFGADAFNPPWGTQPSTLIRGEPELIDGTSVIPVKATWQTPGRISQRTYFVGDDDFLLRRIVDSDRPDASKTATFTHIKVNTAIPEETFHFSAPPGAVFETIEAASAQELWHSTLKKGAEPFPFHSRDLNDRPVSLEQYLDKVVLLHFWRPFPRDIEIAHIQSAYEAYHEEGFEVLGIALSENRERLQSYLRENDIVWPVVLDEAFPDGELAQLYGLKATPISVLIARDGKIAAIGWEAKTLLLDQNIRKALAQPE